MKKNNPLLIVLGISVAFFVLFAIVAVMTLKSLSISGSKTPSSIFSSHSSKSIGVVEVSGVILSAKKILEQLEFFEENPNVKGVIVRLNSPGGAVGPSQEIYDAVRKLNEKKPVYSSMGAVAASGAYYIAVGTKRIFANPGTITGSIGVIMQFTNLSKLFEWAKVQPYNIKTGKHKNLGDPSQEMPAETKQLLQEMIDNVLGQFQEAVAKGRQLPLSKVKPLADGRVFSGEQAKEVKLVDDLGGMAVAVEALAQELGIKGKPKLIYRSDHKKLLERLLDGDIDSSLQRSAGSGMALMKGLQSLLSTGGNFIQQSVLNSDLTGTLGPMFIMSHVLE